METCSAKNKRGTQRITVWNNTKEWSSLSEEHSKCVRINTRNISKASAAQIAGLVGLTRIAPTRMNIMKLHFNPDCTIGNLAWTCSQRKEIRITMQFEKTKCYIDQLLEFSSLEAIITAYEYYWCFILKFCVTFYELVIWKVSHQRKPFSNSATYFQMCSHPKTQVAMREPIPPSFL